MTARDDQADPLVLVDRLFLVLDPDFQIPVTLFQETVGATEPDYLYENP